jgi:hypothetical protein
VVVAFSEVLEDGVALPDDFVVVRMVDEGGDTTVRIEFAILLGLVLLLGKVEDDLAKTGIRMDSIKTTVRVIASKLHLLVTKAQLKDTKSVAEIACKDVIGNIPLPEGRRA